jgi:hypothetical protein
MVWIRFKNEQRISEKILNMKLKGKCLKKEKYYDGIEVHGEETEEDGLWEGRGRRRGLVE